MKKVLSTLLLLVAFCVPWVTQAQTSVPFTSGFEDATDNALWQFANGTNTNQWVIGSAVNNGGSSSLYVSNSAGSTNDYTTSGAQMSWCYRSFNFGAGDYTITFDWRCQGESTWDGMQVFLVPASVTPAAAATNTASLGTLSVSRTTSWTSVETAGYQRAACATPSSASSDWMFTVNPEWQSQALFRVNIATAGSYNLVFCWLQDGSGGSSPAAAVDNISIAQIMCPDVTGITVSDITTTGASVSWNAVEGAVGYEYVLVPKGTAIQDVTPTTTTSTSVSLSNLTANTAYTFYVRSSCGTDQYGLYCGLEFRTACDYLVIPFFTDFEDEVATTSGSLDANPVIPCWSRYNDATSATAQGYPTVYTTTSSGYTHSGTKTMRFYSTTSTSYPSTQIAILPELNTTLNPANTLRLKFWARTNTASATATLMVGVMDDPTDLNTFEPIDFPTIASTTMTEFVVPLDIYMGTGAYVAIRLDRAGSVQVYLDDLTLETLPTCLDPSALAVNMASITTNGCELSWTNGATETQWNVRYKAAGDTAWTLDPTIATTNPYTLTGLAPATTYSIQVRAYCSATDQSPWSNVVEMTTLCLPFEMPLVEDFNDLTEGIPNCWFNNEGTTTNDSYKWNYYATGYDGACLRFNSYINSTNNTNVLVSPAITLTSHAVLNFMAKDPAGGEFSVLAGVSGSSTRDTLVSSIRGVADWTAYDIDLNAYTGQTVVIYFCGTSNYGSNDAYLYLDNFSITAAPTCIKPTAITFNDITAHTASVAWTSRGDETAWNLRYKETTDTTWIEIPSTVTNPYTLSGLEANTNYDVQVRSYCSAEDQSDWTFTETFLTGCDVISSFPWVEGFELVATGSTTSPAPNCWDILNSNIGGNPPYAYVTTSSSSHSGNKSIYMANYNGSYGRGFLIFPELSVPLNTLQVSFWYKNNSTNPSTTCHVTLGYIADVTDSATFVALQELPLTTSWTEFTYFLSNVPARGNARLALRYGDNTQSWSGPNAYIDDITIDLLPTCIRPSDIAVTTTLNSATVSWTSNGTETAWNLRYKASADTSWIEVPSTVTNPYTISGLTPSTSYDVQVRSYCSAEDQSEWCPTFTFKTDFGVPFSESFNVSAIPAEWTIMTGSPDNAFAGTNPTSTTSGWMIKTTSNGLPANHLGINIYNSSTNKWFVSPNIDATGVLSNMVLTFDFAYTDWNNASNPDAGSNQALYVLVSTDNGATWNSANSWAWAHNSTSSAAVTEDLALIPTTGTTLGIDFSRFAGQMVKFAFVATSQSGDNDFHIANVILREGSMTARNVVAISADSTMGTVTGGGSYIDGCEVTLTAVANAGYLFSQWNDGNTDNPRTIVVNSDTNFVATFVPCQAIVVNAANPFIEDFESGILPDCWNQEYVSGTQDWIFATGDGSAAETAHSGSLNAQFQGNSNNATTKLVLSPLDLSALDSAKLSFWHVQADWTGDQNELHVYYRTAANGAWTSLADYTNSIASWTEEVITLPNIGAYYQLAFEGVNNYGHHIALDDITVETASTEPTPTVYDTVYLPNYQTTYYLADNDWFSVLYNDAQDTIFYFDIVADELVSGTTYTLANMLVNFSEVEFNSNAIAYTDASFTFTRNLTTNRDNVTAVVSLTDGQNFVVIYDAEIDTGMQYDTRDTDFVRNYTLAETELDDDYFATYGVVDLSATASDMSSTIAIEFNVASLDADITVPEGVYPINNSEMSGTVLASPGVVGGYIYPSFAATMTASGNLDEAWFMENGTVTVRKVNGLFTALVEATNSYGRNIHILIGDTNAVVVPDSVTFVVSVNDAAMGTVNPMGTVRYAVGDSVTATATANEGYHFVDWTMTVMGMPIPMTENPLSYVIPAMIANQTVNVVANFAADSVPPAADSVTINISVNDPAMGTVDPMGTVRYAVGETVSATATANEGYHFVNWTVNVMTMTLPFTENPLTYEIPAMAANMTVDVIANFAADSVPPAADSVTINISVNDPAMGTVDPMGTVRYAVGETVSATATANDGYHFVNWSISVMGMTIPMTENPLTYEIPAFIPAMAANMTVDVIANFEADSIGISQFNTSTPQQINIYPNPANNVANVKVSGVNGKVNVAVLDMNGRVVMSDSMECDGEAVKSLNVESLAQGAYFVRIYGDDFNSIQKLIVR